jgi:hypothetical protein
MWRSDARSAQIGGPDFILQRLQVIAYSGEPFTSKAACNLLSKHDWRTALGDKAIKVWPEMPLVRFREPPPRVAERLAWARAGPDGTLCRPSRELHGVFPAADASEEMASPKPGNIGCGKLLDVSLIDSRFWVKVP